MGEPKNNNFIFSENFRDNLKREANLAMLRGYYGDCAVIEGKPGKISSFYFDSPKKVVCFTYGTEIRESGKSEYKNATGEMKMDCLGISFSKIKAFCDGEYLDNIVAYLYCLDEHEFEIGGHKKIVVREMIWNKKCHKNIVWIELVEILLSNLYGLAFCEVGKDYVDEYGTRYGRKRICEKVEGSGCKSCKRGSKEEREWSYRIESPYKIRESEIWVEM